MKILEFSLYFTLSRQQTVQQNIAKKVSFQLSEHPLTFVEKEERALFITLLGNEIDDACMQQAEETITRDRPWRCVGVLREAGL